MEDNPSHANVPKSHDQLTIQDPDDPFSLSLTTATAATGAAMQSLVSPQRLAETATSIQKVSHGPSSLSFGSSSSHRLHGSRRSLKYRGIGCRSGKWVSEIREPRKTTRICLGTHPTPEMAAAAYDVATLALKGLHASFNFPDAIHSYPEPSSTSASDIRAAASMDAEARLPHKLGSVGKSDAHQATYNVETSSISNVQPLQTGGEFIDEDELLNMPNLLVDMAGGMLVSPLWMTSPSSDNSPGILEGSSLWNIT